MEYSLNVCKCAKLLIHLISFNSQNAPFMGKDLRMSVSSISKIRGLHVHPNQSPGPVSISFSLLAQPPKLFCFGDWFVPIEMSRHSPATLWRLGKFHRGKIIRKLTVYGFKPW